MPATKTRTKVNLKPLHDPRHPRPVTDSAIYLPESSKDRPKTGTIQAVGDGALNTDTGERIPLTVKKGDRVIFTSYAGTEVKLSGDELLIMSEDDILAIMD